jgi:hypothetical protein
VTQTDPAGNGSAASTDGFNLDTIAPTVVTAAITSAMGAQNNTLNAGDVVSVTVTFNEAVDVTGVPQVTLNVGGVSRTAAYASGFGTTALVFTYTIQSGDTDANGISINAGSIALNGGSIADAAGNAAVLTFAAAADNPSYLVDTTAPTVASFTTNLVAGTYGPGTLLTITATISEALQPGAQLLVTLNTTAATPVTLQSVNGTTFTGSYTIVPGDTTAGQSLAIVGVTPTNTANPSTAVTDAAGNALVVGGANLPPNVVVDGDLKLVPQSGFTDTSSGITNLGIVTAIPIRFNAPVTGLTLNGIVLMLDGRQPLSLRGASLIGSGASYTLIVPRLTTNPKGVYALIIKPDSGIVAAENGVGFKAPLYLLWGNGTTGLTPAGSLAMMRLVAWTGAAGSTLRSTSVSTASTGVQPPTSANAQPRSVSTSAAPRPTTTVAATTAKPAVVAAPTKRPLRK